jgi:hypothetical protein
MGPSPSFSRFSTQSRHSDVEGVSIPDIDFQKSGSPCALNCEERDRKFSERKEQANK